jgi:hypothetical protein
MPDLTCFRLLIFLKTSIDKKEKGKKLSNFSPFFLVILNGVPRQVVQSWRKSVGEYNFNMDF